jgi:hypothetical protein
MNPFVFESRTSEGLSDSLAWARDELQKLENDIAFDRSRIRLHRESKINTLIFEEAEVVSYETM